MVKVISRDVFLSFYSRCSHCEFWRGVWGHQLYDVRVAPDWRVTDWIRIVVHLVRLYSSKGIPGVESLYCLRAILVLLSNFVFVCRVKPKSRLFRSSTNRILVSPPSDIKLYGSFRSLYPDLVGYIYWIFYIKGRGGRETFRFEY